MELVAALLLGVFAPAFATGQATSDGLQIKAVAEVETRAIVDGRDSIRLAPADRVVPGDRVIYTLQIRNPGATAVPAPTIVYAIPAHMAYVPDSATGPGADILFSTDGGHTFDRPENLRMVAEDGVTRLAKGQNYTHIQWKMRNSLKSKSVAFAHFAAVVR